MYEPQIACGDPRAIVRGRPLHLSLLPAYRQLLRRHQRRTSTPTALPERQASTVHHLNDGGVGAERQQAIAVQEPDEPHAVDAGIRALVVAAKQIGVGPAKCRCLLCEAAGTEGTDIGYELTPATRRYISRRSLWVKLVKDDRGASTRSTREFPCGFTVTGTMRAAEILTSSRSTRSTRRKKVTLSGAAFDSTAMGSHTKSKTGSSMMAG